MAVMLEEPTGPVTAEGTDRIWFITKLREFSGAIEVSMSERVALRLTGLDAAALKEAHPDGSLQFSLLCNTRVSRSLSTGASGHTGASQPGASQTGASQTVSCTNAKTFVNHTLQEAEPLDWNSTLAPNAAYENVLTMLNALPKNEAFTLASSSTLNQTPMRAFGWCSRMARPRRVPQWPSLLPHTRKTSRLKH